MAQVTLEFGVNSELLDVLIHCVCLIDMQDQPHEGSSSDQL